MSYQKCLQKQQEIKTLFETCSSKGDKYEKIIEIGKNQPLMDRARKTAENRVEGCQSTMYLYSWVENGLVYYQAWSDALISSGLAWLLTQVYSGETPAACLKCPPNFIEELDLPASLSPNRANGLYHIHLKMKQDALKYLAGLK